MNEYTAPMIKRLNTKLISVSLTECDLLSMSINIYIAQIIPPDNIIQPSMDLGT